MTFLDVPWQAVVDKLLSKRADKSLLLSRFQEFLEMDDVRYYVMSSVRENLARVMDRSRGVGESSLVPLAPLVPLSIIRYCPVLR